MLRAVLAFSPPLLTHAYSSGLHIRYKRSIVLISSKVIIPLHGWPHCIVSLSLVSISYYQNLNDYTRGITIVQFGPPNSGRGLFSHNH